MTRNSIVGGVTVEAMLRADETDTINLQAAISDVLADVDILVAVKVLSEMIVQMARQIHGVQMKVVFEPKAATTPGG